MVAIEGFRHKGIEQFFATGAKSGIQANHADRLRLILGPSERVNERALHELARLGTPPTARSQKGHVPVKVSGNWRVTFTCAGKDVDRVDYEDYH